MCGIAGKITKNATDSRDVLWRMNKLMYHRGPDDSAVWFSDDWRVGLSHCRLSIIDLANGKQPMEDVAGQLVIVFNGEIYNYRELREELIAKGHKFKNRSDTEVILQAYHEWGDEFLSRLNGMFAFCLYDHKRQRLLLARDRAGEKPLYYFQGKEGFTFASELKTLLSDPSILRRIDLHSLEYFLAYGAVNGEMSIIEGVYKLLPGQALIYNVAQNEFRKFTYWQLPEYDDYTGADLTDLVDELERLLEDSVKRQLVADVPVGVLLSGGIDSSLITAMAARVSGKPVNTYTISFPGHGEFDEAPFAQKISSHFGTNHNVLEVEPFDVEILHLMAKQFDEPIGDQAIVPTYLISKLISSEAKVALSGDGGDELFGGYGHYTWLERQDRIRNKLPPMFRRFLSQVARHMLPIGFKGRNHLIGLEGESSNSVAGVNMYFDSLYRKKLLSPLSDVYQCSNKPENYKKSFCQKDMSVVRQATITDFHTTLSDAYLVKVDRASMLASLEIRCPWLDYRIIDFAFSQVTDHFRVCGKDRKILPKQLSQKILPHAFDVDRKRGFIMPLDNWFKGSWGQDIKDILMDMDENVFDKKVIEAIVNSQEHGNSNMQRIFALLMFSLWSNEHDISI